MVSGSIALPVNFAGYTLLKRIAVGGMAEIFLAELHGLGGFRRDVVVKKILPQFSHDPSFVAMLLDEARIAATLVHPNIVQVLNCGEYDGSNYLVLEYVPGQSLRRLLRRQQEVGEKLSMAEAMYIAQNMLAGLNHAHEQRDDNDQPMHIVHRDVTPENVLLSYNGEVKLTDFGIAKATGRSQRTQTGVVKGKLAYMSPEQIKGDPVDHRLDQYAMALVLFELLAGERFHRGESEDELLSAVLQGGAARSNLVRDLGTERGIVGDALRRALERSVNRRFATCADLAADLAEAYPPQVMVNARQALGTRLARLFAAERERERADVQKARSLRPPPEIAQASGKNAEPGLFDLPTSPTMTLPPPVKKRGAIRWRQPLGGLLRFTSILLLSAGFGGAVGYAQWFYKQASAPAVVTPAVASAQAAPPPAPTAQYTMTPAVPTPKPTPSSTPPPAPPSPNLAPAPAPPPAPKLPPGQPRPGSAPARGRHRGATSRGAAALGSLDVACLPWCEVSVDGQSLHKASPLRGHPLAAGDHEVTVVNPPSGRRETRRVTVQAGERSQLHFRLAD